MTFCFIRISLGIEAVTAESDETVEHFQIISFEDHNKCAAGDYREDCWCFGLTGMDGKLQQKPQKATEPLRSHLENPKCALTSCGNEFHASELQIVIFS